MRYFFDIRDDLYTADDDTGEEHVSLEAARQEAVKIATSIAADLFASNGSEVRVIVRDERAPLLEVTVTLATKELVK
ncbi:hypothetical protein QRQ56_30865 [Bradyrhizobium sp. U531]|uniref:DUF6894 family protein n=1 Tax=Bradyrhizobium sp. U531 TaxID=3053458 RepID=UPI003F42732A